MIYFFQSKTTGHVKIGTTRQLKTRLRALSRKHGPGVVLGVQEGGRHVEAHIHKRFSGSALGGEWFQPGADLSGYIRDWARPWDGKDERGPVSAAQFFLTPAEMQRAKSAAKALRSSFTSFVRMSALSKLADVERDMAGTR